MYQLTAQPAPAEQWLTLIDGDAPVRVLMRAVGPSALGAARQALVENGHPVEDFAKDAGFDAFCRELCRRAIVAWEGIGQDGQPAPLTASNIDALLSDSTLLARLQSLYVYPYLIREQEKNGSAPSSNGTSPATTGAKGTAGAARPAVKRARTPSTPRKRTVANKSGR